MDVEQKARRNARDCATYRSMAAERKDELLERRRAAYALKKKKMNVSVGATIPACASSSAANNAGLSRPGTATMSWNSVRWSRFPAIQAMTNHITKVVQSLNNSRIRKNSMSMELPLSRTMSSRVGSVDDAGQNKKKGMVLPFEPHSITFQDITYAVDMPQEMATQGGTNNRLALERPVYAFRSRRAQGESKRQRFYQSMV